VAAADRPQDRIAYSQADVANYGAVEQAIRRAETRFGKIEYQRQWSAATRAMRENFNG
jgi:NAD(P)-dependent dehydrogenase (short-subunit alcohol dehydrogenase family)